MIHDDDDAHSDGTRHGAPGPGGRRASSLWTGYRPRPATYDESVAADGSIRPHWRTLVAALDELGPEELSRRRDQAQRQIASDGVTFTPHDVDGGSSRPWVLDAVPLVLAEDEWKTVTDGLAQRARLFDRLLRDLLGPQHLLREKIVPPDVLFGNPGWHPAYQHLEPSENRFLHLYAADLARAADGTWWATGDRARAPYGLGYVLENRIVASRMLPDAFRACGVHRLASFFIVLRETLRELAPRFKENPRIVAWTKGPTSRSYFEDAYLARYLGHVLVEGGDLAVRQNRVMLKTLGGLLPIEVLFRRIDDDDADPVELRSDSAIGVPGLLEVLRAGNVAVANPLGSRLLEAPILQAFLPRICRFLLGEEPALASPRTWWCGDPAAHSHVLANLDELLIRPAYRTADDAPLHPARLSAAERQRLLERLAARPREFVAQETVPRSTAPVWTAGATVPWHHALRAYLVGRGDGYVALPGALARVAPDDGALDGSMTSGELSQDVWIRASGKVEDVTLLAPPGQVAALRRSGAELPSRVADNLFWLGRTVERAEGTARLLRTVLGLLSGESERRDELLPLLRVLADLGQIEPDHVVAGLSASLPDVAATLPNDIFDPRRTSGLRAAVVEAVRLVSIVRDRVSVDAWRIVRRIEESSRRPPGGEEPDVALALDVADRVVTELTAFSGLVAESMTRTQGWRFLDLGRRIERALHTASLLRSTIVVRIPEERAVLEAVLQTADSILTHRTRYLATVEPATVLDLLLADETNPRSVAFQLEAVQRHVDGLPRDERQVGLGPEQRMALALYNSVRLADVFELVSADGEGRRTALERLLRRVAEQLPRLSDAISGRFLIHAGLPRHFASAGGTPS